jgi:hypothetical protein
MELASQEPNGSSALPELASKPKASSRIIKPTKIQIARELEVVARFMDNQFAIPVVGWRFGMNAIIDLIPGVGDIGTTLIALYILVSAVRYRVPKITLLRMGVNIAIYFLVGLVPWVGDLFDVWWKPNIRNLKLLASRATVSAADAKQGRKSDWLFVGVIVGTLLTLLFASLAVSAFVIWSMLRLIQQG